jgi:hypothetical protein
MFKEGEKMFTMKSEIIGRTPKSSTVICKKDYDIEEEARAQEKAVDPFTNE